MTELVVKIDLKDMLKDIQQEVREVEKVPAGYRCQECWQDDGSHIPTCAFRSSEVNRGSG